MPQLKTTLTRPAAFRAGAEMPLTLTVEGPGRFCIYHTPFEGVRNHFMEVRGPDGALVEYRGVMAKRVPPGPEHYITLTAGQKRSAEFDLTEGYVLNPGEYRLRFAGDAISGLPPSAEIVVRVAP